MLQAGRQLVAKLAATAKPKAVPEQSGSDREGGQQETTEPC
jgi:hypothetical protein